MPENNPLSPHLDPNTLAAFAAHKLRQRERTRVFEHLVICERCREWVAVHAEVSEEVRRDRRRTAPVWAVAAAGIACLFGSAAWMMSGRLAQKSPEATRVRLPSTSRLVQREMPSSRLPVAWQQVRLAPDLFPLRRSDQFSLSTTVGEKWIGVPALFSRAVTQY